MSLDFQNVCEMGAKITRMQPSYQRIKRHKRKNERSSLDRRKKISREKKKKEGAILCEEREK